MYALPYNIVTLNRITLSIVGWEKTKQWDALAFRRGQFTSRPLCQDIYLLIYLWDAILVDGIPWEENALSHSLYLLVLDWCWCVRAGLEDGGWEIDHQWMSVRGVLTLQTTFHAHNSQTLSCRKPMPSETVHNDAVLVIHADLHPSVISCIIWSYVIIYSFYLLIFYDVFEI